MEEDQASKHSTRPYRGVRQRKWGKWVSEMREPGKKTRIWLGSYESPEMAAAAYDVAALHFKGHVARLNFPDLIDSLPKPASSNAEDVQVAAQEAAKLFKRPVDQMRSGGDGSNLVPIRVGLSPSQIQAINESPLDSPKMWMELAGALLSAEPMVLSHDIDELSEWDEIKLDSIWDF
ncbi:Ethylene-responsive transcription factor ERF021 [Camellia lanceoleosa]|uniref:Ethylene-responsive transcription factor ERF021 n=1 Tax=Camellia lanceoleosa TaxID=1840588 RepID=A0ACC0FTE3_9ERIC|nr:Ethylene-responsive transcription factor ERF021 [Camellia lanceoleosa]